MKINCPRCGGRAHTIYIQSAEEGRAWEKIGGLLWCRTERAIIRIEDQRRLLLILADAKDRA